ncbi:Hypothetical protein Nlim_1880 [Candidatus Nitrosarchaeum limnium SFB1]|jgi:hypothetical protein|uniref:Uncharacterized protein n=1 Tax=Candidatus Nitrosarchaeum limnium SFB1 TaxID=886738 RepID=F3KN99_9ARCH|nr:Hypothetical protein Nlim_1880 [Candidatus Nitrosarchaeum limnium SFB1]
MQSLSGMRLVTFPTESAEGQAFSELMLIDKSIHIVNDGKYVISEKQCTHLKEKGIDYNVEETL